MPIHFDNFYSIRHAGIAPDGAGKHTEYEVNVLTLCVCTRGRGKFSTCCVFRYHTLRTPYEQARVSQISMWSPRLRRSASGQILETLRGPWSKATNLPRIKNVFRSIAEGLDNQSV